MGLMGLGAALVLTALAVLLIPPLEPERSSPLVPGSIAGYSLTSKAAGDSALKEFSQLHGQSLPVLSGTKASYGNGATLWVAETRSLQDARRLMDEMRDRIGEGRSPFTPSGTVEDRSRPIYKLDGMGQNHFYFQSGRYLIWLAADPEIADRSLQEVLSFYP